MSRLYILSDKSNVGQFKIGETSKPIYERINKYKTSNPNVNLEFCTHIFKYGATIESKILIELYDFRVPASDGTLTEWLRCDIEKIVNLIIKYMNNIQLLDGIEKEAGCKWIMQSGQRKGLKCSEKIHASGFCVKHAKNLTEIGLITDGLAKTHIKTDNNSERRLEEFSLEEDYDDDDMTCEEDIIEKINDNMNYKPKDYQQSSIIEKEEENKSINKISEANVDGCEWIMKNGPRKGHKCSEKIHTLNMCVKHVKISERSSSKADKSSTSEEEDETVEKMVEGCQWLLKSGPRKGEKCSEKIHSLNMCSKHFKMSEDSQSKNSDEENKSCFEPVIDGCVWILKSGPRKGENCSERIHSSSMCSKHVKMSQESSSKNH